MAAKQDVIDKLEQGYQEFRAKFADLPDEAFKERMLGDWDLSQLLAHMAGWYREMTGAIERVGRGERPAPEGVDYSDADSWNAKFAELARPGREALRDFDEAFAGYKAAALNLREDLFGVDPEKGRPRIGDRLLDAAGINHFQEHLPHLDEWLRDRRARGT